MGGAILGVLAVYFLATINLRSLGLPIGEWPRLPLYVYTTSKVTLTFDGEEISIEGTTRCRRRIEMNEDGDLRPLMFLDHIGFSYYCGPEWFGHRFEDGSALLVGAYSNSGPWLSAWRALLPEQPDLSHFDRGFRSRQISRVPPAVVWLDNVEAPIRAEYYYSMAALADPRSRLTAMQHKADMWPASLWTSIFSGRAPTDPSDEVPAVVRPSNLYRMVGHYAVELPAERWSALAGLKEALADLSDPTLLRPPDPVSEALFRELSATILRQVQSLPPPDIRHGVAAIPLDVATGKNAGRLSGFTASIRSVTPDSSEFHSFRFDDSLPNGALMMSARTTGTMSDSATFMVGDRSAADAYRLMWFGGILYEPTSNAVHYLRVIGF